MQARTYRKEVSDSTRFVSTRAIFRKEESGAGELGFIDAVFQGLAPDGGLYYPTTYVDLSDLFISYDKDSTFIDVSSSMTRALFPSEFNESEARGLCERAFHFTTELHTLNEELTLLELFHGPSCAFKDFGASYLASVMEKRVHKEGKCITILTATSGDTGSAVAQAFYEKQGIEVIILYPSGRVSPLQERQLTCLGKNIHAFEVNGSFDDCQWLVKNAFQNDELKQKYGLSSANSINIGRLVPQSFYYVHAWNQLRHRNEGNWIFCVPSGNFGNLTAGLLAKQWGLPITHVLAASNANDVVPLYLKSGMYMPKKSIPTLANAMDVGSPSNFERLETMFALEAVKQGADYNANDFGNFIHQETLKSMHGMSISDMEIKEEIAHIYKTHHEYICPHTAVGTLVSRKILAEAWAKRHGYNKAVVLSTAHPAKFHEVIEDISGTQVSIPERLARFFDMNPQATFVEATQDAFYDALEKVLG